MAIQGFKGLERVIKKFEDAPNEIKQLVKEELEITSQLITREAVKKAPVNDGNLRNSIGEQMKGLKVINFVNADYAPYVEFGTKTKVKVPTELINYALQFKGGKMSHGDLREKINNWCKSKGIPKEAWGAVFWSIVTNGIKAQPFFFPAWFKYRKEFAKNLKGIMAKWKGQISK